MTAQILSSTIGICCQRCSLKLSVVTAMWSVSNRTGTSSSKSEVFAIPAVGAVVNVIKPVVTFTAGRELPHPVLVDKRRAGDRLGDRAHLNHAARGIPLDQLEGLWSRHRSYRFSWPRAL
jgi:hypothetical protein